MKRGTTQRATTIPTKRKRAQDAALEAFMASAEYAVAIASRPRIREQCLLGPRPCPWVWCRHHLYLDVNPETGSIKLNHPGLEPWELAVSCSLDVADEGERTLEFIGDLLNLTRERVRQVEQHAYRNPAVAELRLRVA